MTKEKFLVQFKHGRSSKVFTFYYTNNGILKQVYDLSQNKNIEKNLITIEQFVKECDKILTRDFINILLKEVD